MVPSPEIGSAFKICCLELKGRKCVRRVSTLITVLARCDPSARDLSGLQRVSIIELSNDGTRFLAENAAPGLSMTPSAGSGQAAVQKLCRRVMPSSSFAIPVAVPAKYRKIHMGGIAKVHERKIREVCVMELTSSRSSSNAAPEKMKHIQSCAQAVVVFLASGFACARLQ